MAKRGHPWAKGGGKQKRGTATAERLYKLYERSRSQSAWYKWQAMLHKEAMARKAQEPKAESYADWRRRMRMKEKSYGG